MVIQINSDGKTRKLSPKEEKDWKLEQKKREKEKEEHVKPLRDYIMKNCSIQRIGFDEVSSGEKFTIPELIERAKGLVSKLDKYSKEEDFGIDHQVGIIQITDDEGRISQVLDSYTRLKELIDLSKITTAVYERGYYSRRDSPWYWNYSTHLNFDLDLLNKTYQDNYNFLQNHLPKFERAFTLSTFTDYLDILGFPNGIDNWDNEKIFKSSYLAQNDSKWLIGNSNQLGRYFDSSRYLQSQGGNQDRQSIILSELENRINAIRDIN